MKDRGYPIITVSRRAETTLLAGHPWIFDTEVLNNSRAYADGDIVNVVNSKGAFLGTGFINRNSKIRVRIFTRNPNDTPDEAYWRRRVKQAIDLRKTVMGSQFSCCRLIFGESDYFPGLTVDRFGDILVTQTLSLGMERIKHIVFPLILKQLAEYGEEINGIYERNDVPIRQREGLEQSTGWYLPSLAGDAPATDVIITENGIKYHVDIANGQKTGFFLDQKVNRSLVGSMAHGRRVLDCFTHTGSFALNAAAGGAQMVTAVDISQDALDTAQRNAQLNGLQDAVAFKCANVFDLLASMRNDEKYDFIILDPPAFTKSRATVESAAKGYKEINLRAMKLLPKGGLLATCSCSHFMTDALFRDMLHAAASDANVSLRQLSATQQAPDHPIMWNVPETEYLKFYIFQIA